MITTLISVAVGGALGALMRYGASIMVAGTTIVPVWVATLAVNITGCALMGVMVGLMAQHPVIIEPWRPFIMVGFLGALTTFSSFALDSFTLLEQGHYLTLCGYLAASFTISLSAFFAAYSIIKAGQI